MTMQADRKRQVALVSMGASGLLTMAKFGVGLMTGSLAILSEALHSLLDFAATALTWFAVGISDKPADDTHHYGHGKIESVTALIATGLLFATSAWVIQEAVKRLIWQEGAVMVTPTAIGVVLASILIDFWRARALSRTAKATRSQALEADALHFSSDMWSSMVVLAGLGLVWLGFRNGDSIAAIFVAILVAIAGWRLGKSTIDVLMDAAPQGAADDITAIAESVEGVVSVESVRVRAAGSSLFVDLLLLVPRALPLDQVVLLKQRVIDKLVAKRPEAQIRITANPVAIDNESVRDRVMVIAVNRRLAVHHVTVQTLSGGLSISFDLEVDHRMPLGEAHVVASDLEAAIRREFGEEIEVETHIEPLLADDVEGHDVDDATRAAMVRTIERLTDSDSGLVDALNVRVRRTPRGLILTLHCRAAPQTPVQEVHERVDALERRIRASIEDIARIVIHAEPVR
jgi:cation diffusion facilitator family transporter